VVTDHLTISNISSAVSSLCHYASQDLLFFILSVTTNILFSGRTYFVLNVVIVSLWVK